MVSRKSVGNNIDDTTCVFTGNLEEDNDNEGWTEIGGITIPPPPQPALTFDPTGPRLFIQEIVIENFKSYGGKTILGPFHKNFAAIIGPNGSGKSNVIDALLFVFGYRAQKIRSKTVGVLIHKSDAYPNCESCRVSVHFQKIIDKGKDDYEVVPESEFVVSRVAHKDNSSYYLIDERRVQFKEVSRLLRSFGIDLDHNRFLILQGEVEQISLMKPMSTNQHETGMLEFLEDIIGTGRLKEPIEKLQKNVDELNDRRAEKLNRVKSAQTDKDELEGLRNDALKYINLKNEAAHYEHTCIQNQMYRCNQKIKTQTQNLETIEQNSADFLTNYKQVEDEMKIISDGIAELSTKKENVSKRLEENREKYSQVELEDVSNREDMKHAKEKIRKLMQSMKEEAAKVEELKEAPEKLQTEIRKLRAEDEEMKTKRLKAENNLSEVTSSLKAETSELQEEKEAQERVLFDRQAVANDLKSKVDVAQSELDLYMMEEEKEKNKLESLKINLQSTEANMEQMKNDVTNLTAEIPEIEKSRENNVRRLELTSNEEPIVTKQFQNLRTELEDAKSTLNVHNSRDRLLSALLKEKVDGRIPGIIGRLGDLGGIDVKYDVAVSTACPQLDDIVTDSLETAMTCVKFLKENTLGLATFIALDKMDVWRQYVGKTINTPQNVPRLFDLIKVKDDKYLPAFYFVMRDTLVANDIRQATAIGLQGQKRYRVVTLKGELVELSGTMSGGGTKVVKGRMGTSAAAERYSAEEIRDMEKKVSELQTKREELVAMKTMLEETVIKQERDLETKRHAVVQMKKELEQLKNHEISLNTQIKEQEAKCIRVKTDPKRTSQLTKVLEAHQKDFFDADKKTSELKAKILELHKRIVEVGGNKLKNAQKMVNEVSKRLDQITEDINKKTIAITTSKKNGDKAKSNIAKMESEITQLQESRSKLKEKIAEADVKGSQLIEESNLIKEEITEVESEMRQSAKALKKLQSTRSEMERKKLDIRNEIEVANRDIRHIQAEFEAWKVKLSKIKQIEIEVAIKPFVILNEDEISATDISHIEELLTNIKGSLKELKPNLGVIEQYKEKEKVYLQRVEEFDAVTKERDDMRKCHDELRKRRFNEFMNGFTIISRKLKETYQMVTLGGDADLELVNSLDPFSDGILFSVRPPRKSWKNISNLSGGEKTLSSLSLVFSLHYYKPTPFYIMDEIDAALDFRNVAIVAHYIKEQTKNAQFIVVSLRENMFEQADRLVGVYKTYDTSHSVCLDLCSYANVGPKVK